MKNTLHISGENKSVRLTPENEADKKILEVIAQCEPTAFTVERLYNYSDRDIKQIEIILTAKE